MNEQMVPRTAATIVERAGSATLVALATGVITWLNTEAEHQYGYRSDELLGRSLLDLAPDSSRSELTRMLARAAAGEQIDDVLVVRRHRNGTEFPLTISLHPLPTAEIPELGREQAAGFEGPGTTTSDLEALLDRIPGIVFDLDGEARILRARGAGLGVLGFTEADAVGVPLMAFADDESARANIERVLGGGNYTGPVFLAGAIWEINAVPHVDERGVLTGVACSVFPAQQGWDSTTAIALTEARYRALVQHSSDLVAVVDAQLDISYVSPSIEALLGWRPDEVIGRPMTDFVRGEDLERLRQYFEDAGTGRPPTLVGTAGAAGRWGMLDLRLRHKRGGWRYYELVNSDYLDDPAVQGVVLNGRDVTERRQADLRLRHASLHDPLTDLPNRTLLIERVDDGLLQVASVPDRRLAVVAIGLDRFKLVNDSLGHQIGDQLLVAVCRRLRHHVRAGDTVARLGGDTFVVTSSGVQDESGAEQLAQRLLGVLSEPYDLEGRRIVVTACAGVSINDGDVDGATLVRDADSALYAAKHVGRNRFETYSPALRSNATRQLSLEQSLRRATIGGQLRVHFQPIMRLRENEVCAAEALVRWEHPELGLVPPLDFIPLAEDTGHIVEIGAWVLLESCRTAMEWAQDQPLLRMSVNLSPRQLLETDLPDVVAAVLADTGFPADMLTMEVTESVLVDDGPFVNRTLARLRELGVSLAIDDFGTGYSSLVYLRRLQASALKIDRSFVDGIGRDNDSDAIVRAVVSLAHSLGLDIVAEGIETVEQRDQLIALGCQFAQGYLFSKPLPAEEFRRWRMAERSSLLH